MTNIARGALTLVVHADLVPRCHLEHLVKSFQKPYRSRHIEQLTSSNVPKPPGKPTKADALWAISTFRSCIELTTI